MHSLFSSGSNNESNKMLTTTTVIITNSTNSTIIFSFCVIVQLCGVNSQIPAACIFCRPDALPVDGTEG